MSREEAIEQLNDLIKDIQMAMLVTIDDGMMRARPMATQRTPFDGTLWFMTSTSTHKVEEIRADNRVNVSYANPSKNSYVSVSGRAEVVTDRAMIEEQWNPIYKAWFPDGLDDPTICLLKITVERAEFWDSSSSTFVQVAGFIKALTTGKRADGGDHEQLQL